jgi:hypothetical protein
METKGLVIIWGALALFVVLIIVGAILSNPIGHGILAVGVIGIVFWCGSVIWLMNAMNTDI